MYTTVAINSAKKIANPTYIAVSVKKITRINIQRSIPPQIAGTSNIYGHNADALKFSNIFIFYLPFQILSYPT